MHIIYFYTVYFYQISPTCFGVLYTTLRDNFVHLLKTVSLLQGYNLIVPCCLLLPCVSLPPSFISRCSMFSLTLLSQFASLSISPSSITSIRRVSVCVIHLVVTILKIVKVYLAIKFYTNTRCLIPVSLNKLVMINFCPLCGVFIPYL